MKNTIKNLYKNRSGVTFVALIVTIIVLIIVSSITIMTLTGDDGTIKRALNARTGANRKQAQTEVNEEWFALQNDTRKEDKTNSELAADLQERLNQRLTDEDQTADATVTYTDDDHPLVVAYKGQNDIELAIEPTIQPGAQGENTEHITITSHPQNFTVLEEFTASFSVTATVSKGEPTYQWYRTTKNEAIGGEKIDGATQSTFVISNTIKSDEMYYYCEVSAKYDGLTERAKSNVAKLTVKAVIKEVTVTPAELVVPLGKTITLTATAEGESEIHYKWYSVGTNTNQGGSLLNAPDSSTYTKENAAFSDDKYYYCEATQSFGGNSKTLASNPAKVTVINSNVTYEYGIDQNYLAKTYTDTGYNINWDNDFTIETTVNIPEQGHRYLIIGSYDESSANELNIEITADNMLRVYFGKGGHGKTSGTIPANTDVKVTFTWTARTHSYTITAQGTGTNISMNDININNASASTTGMANKTLRIGCVDNRGLDYIFSPITVKSLKITEMQDPGDLRLPVVNRVGWTFNGWYTAPTGGTLVTQGTQVATTPRTYYARYSDGIKPEIVSATPSTTLDTSNFVDFTAVDNGVQISGYNITTTDQQPSNWIPVVDIVEAHTETKWFDNAAWARVFHHNNHWGKVYYLNEAEALTADSIDKYSVLGHLANYKNNNNKYEFLLQYPQVSTIQYNRWLQTDNPATLSNSDGAGQQLNGYQAVHIDWNLSWSGGLAKSSKSSNTFIDGERGDGWWYAIGAYSSFAGGTAGPKTTNSQTGLTIAVENLWARIDEKTASTTNSLTRRLGDLTQNGTYYIWVKDVNGNVGSKSVEVTKVDTENPIAEISYTNNVATSQTITLTMGDNNGIVEYYWGTVNPSNSNVTWTTYNNSTSATETKTVSTDGTYYLGVKDAAGNITVVSKTFYKTTLNPGSATVTPTSIITAQGESFNIPDPTAVTGYDFNGWFTAASGGTQRTNPYTPTASATLYAHHGALTYSVRFDPNGGTGHMDDQVMTYDTSTALNKNTYVRDGYAFNGWNGLIYSCDDEKYYANDGEYTTNDNQDHEFMQYDDLAPYLDKYGLGVSYELEFDIKSENTTNQNTIFVYFQNGSPAKYNLAGGNTLSRI